MEKEGRVKVSSKFILALSIVSIIGFASIVSETLLDFDLSGYAEASLMIIIGIGLIWETNFGEIKTLAKGINPSNLTHLTTIIVSVIAVIGGIFSIPQIRIDNPGFLAIKGIISLIAIAVIIIQTWVIE